MRYATVCSGIGAPSEAWRPLGWRPVFTAENAAFPAAVLAARHGGVPNLGDITAADFTARARALGPVDVLAAGTPCQAFSVAGARRSLTDARGNLTLRFVEIVHALGPAIVLWENVPGILSLADNAFGCLLAGLVGARGPIACPIRDGRWPSAGMAAGPRRTAAWRILDAQYFGLAQRRRRLFVISGRTGGGPNPGAILFEPESLPRHTPPSRQARPEIARCPTGSTGGHGEPIPVHNTDIGGIARDRPRDGAGIGQPGDPPFTIGTHPRNAIATAAADLADPICANEQRTTSHAGNNPRPRNLVAYAFQPRIGRSGRGQPSDVVPALAGADAGATSDSRPCVAVSLKLDNGSAQPTGGVEVTPTICQGGNVGPMGTLRSSTHAGSGIPFLPLVFQERARDGQPNVEYQEDLAYALLNSGRGGRRQEMNLIAPLAFARNTRDEVRLQGGGGQMAGARSAQPGMKQTTYIATRWAIRRLTPRECERLQGFGDGYTGIAYGRPRHPDQICPDGPRYSALGNAMPVPVIRWLGRRIEKVLTPWRAAP